MFLLKAKKVFIKKMTILTLILSVVIGLIYHLFIGFLPFLCFFTSLVCSTSTCFLWLIGWEKIRWFHCFWFAKEQSFLSVC